MSKNKTIHKLRHIAEKSIPLRRSRIMTLAEVQGKLMALQSCSVSYMVNSRTKTIFFTNGHGFGHPHMPKEFVPVTTHFPQEGLTIDELIGKRHAYYTKIESVEELAPIMDKFYPEFGNVKGYKSNWQPEHFPVGTVIELAKFHVNTETGEVYSCYIESVPCIPLKVTVTAVVRNGIDSYCIITDRPSSVTEYDSYNFSHIGRIIKRGDGPVLWKSYKLDPYLEKSRFQREPLGPKHYWWSDASLMIPHIMRFIPGSGNVLLRRSDLFSISRQSFAKKKELFEFYTVYHCRKKKLRRFVQQNFNRWKLTGKEIRKLQAEDDDDFDRRMNEDLEYLEGHSGPSLDEDEVTQAINSHGNNQCYLNGEEVCGECKCAYTNHGPSPLGYGTMCQGCRDTDDRLSESMYHEDDRPENFTPMLMGSNYGMALAAEVTQSATALVSGIKQPLAGPT